MAAAKLASAFPELDVVLRLHPTMAHPAREGSGSRERIEAYCRDAGRSNLMVSQLSLDEDFESGRPVLSEHPQAFIDAIAMGRLGMVVNGRGDALSWRPTSSLVCLWRVTRKP